MVSDIMIGKKVVVRANVAGVHVGVLKALDKTTAVLDGAYRIWRVYTRDKSGSMSDLAAHGLKPKTDHSIGAKLKTVLIENPAGLEVSEMTDEAFASIESYVAGQAK